MTTKKPFARPLSRKASSSVCNQSSAAKFLSQLPNPKEVTSQARSNSTFAKYLHRVKNYLLPKIIEQEDNDSPESIYSWLSIKSFEVKPSTFRQYRAALICHLENVREKARPQDKDVINIAISNMKEMKPQPKTDSPKKTSSMKRKYIKEHEMAFLLSSLSASRGIWARAAALYIRANIQAGLRPSEWFNVKLNEDKVFGDTIMTIENAKNTNYRSTGSHRYILIPKEMDIEYIKGYLILLQKIQENKLYTPDLINRSIAKIIARYSLKLFGKEIHITPYTIRHQFSANAKNLYSKEEIAMLQGHRSSDTSGLHYGKRRSGFQSFKEEFNNNKIQSTPSQNKNQAD